MTYPSGLNLACAKDMGEAPDVSASGNSLLDRWEVGWDINRPTATLPSENFAVRYT